MKRWHKCYLYQSSLLLETFPGTAKVAGDQKGSRKTAQQPGARDWNFSTLVSAFPETRYWEPALASPACGQQLPRAAGFRARNLPSQLSLLCRPLPLPQGRGQRRPPPSSPPLWCLLPRGGSDPTSSWPSTGTASPSALGHTMGPEAGLQHSSDDAGGSPGDSQLPPWPPRPPLITRIAVVTNGRRF